MENYKWTNSTKKRYFINDSCTGTISDLKEEVERAEEEVAEAQKRLAELITKETKIKKQLNIT